MTYPAILQLLLQKSWTTQSLIFCLAWDDLAMFDGTPNYEQQPSKRQEGANSKATYCPVQEQQPNNRPPHTSPLNEKLLLP
jgi:hypothetical protein